MSPARRAVTDSARTVLLAITFFGALALEAWHAGVLERLGADVTAAVAAFSAGFFVLTLGCDAELRAWLAASARRFRSTRAKSPGAKRAAS